MTVSIGSRLSTGIIEYQKRTYSKKTNVEKEITYDFVDAAQANGRHQLFNAGVKSGGVSIRSPANLLLQRMRETKAAETYIASLMNEVTEEARLIPFTELTKDTENKTKANLAFKKSATPEALVLCYALMKILLRHYAPIINNSEYIKNIVETALLELLIKKMPAATNELSRIAPEYIQHLHFKQQVPGVFVQLESFADSLKTIETSILKELRDAIMNGDHEFFIAYHSEVSTLDDLRAFIVKLPNQIYENVLEDLLFLIDDVSNETK